MFEREIQFIYDFSHNKIKRLGSFITYEQIKSTDIHPAILQYISGEIDFYIFEDRQKLLKESLFDYSGETINNYFSLISTEIKKEKRFSQNFIEKLILHAVTFTVNYLSTPNTLISQFIFEEEKEKSSTEIKQILNYLYYYPHIKKIVSSYLDKKGLLKISNDQFENLLKKIDAIGLESDVSKIFDEALNSMADFFNIGVSKRNIIPKSVVENYLQEKSLTDHLNKLSTAFTDPEITKYDIQDYQKILLSVGIKKEDVLEVQSEASVFEDEISSDKTDIGIFEEVETEEKDENDDEESSEDSLSDVDSYTASVAEDETSDAKQTIDNLLDDNDEFEMSDLTVSEPVDAESEEPMESESADETKEKHEVEDEDYNNDVIDAEQDIAEIEDEREVESESITEVIEFAKEEIEIRNFQGEDLEDSIEDTSDGKMALDDSDDDEIIFEEEEDELAEVHESIEADQDKVESEDVFEDDEQDEARNLYLQETGSKDEIDEKLKIDNTPNDEQITDYGSDEKFSSKFSSESEMDFEEDEKEDLEEEEIAAEITNDEEETYLDIEDVTSGKSEIDYNEQLLDEEETAEDDEPDAESLDESQIGISENEDENEDEHIQEEKSDEELSLFNGEEILDEIEDFDSDGEDEESIVEDLNDEEETPEFDISRLLENKKMKKIIDVIFDFDMEEFANAIEKITESGSKEKALAIIDKICGTAQINPTSKEAKIFKSIISEYFNNH